jgi:D-threo-aldose 1-dehydrogenase
LQTRTLGRTQVRFTTMALGGAPLAGLFTPIGDEEAYAVVDAAWDVGIRTFDTAPQYGAGLGERRLGAALRDRPRDEYSVTTKTGRLVVPRGAPDGEHADVFAESPDLDHRYDYSAAGMRRSLEDSLERMGLDRVDTLLVHDPDRPEHLDQAIREGFPELVRMREEGLIGAIGAGMNYPEPLARIVREADVDALLAAGQMTLLDQRGLEELAPLCEERGVAIFAGGVFNSGILADPKPGATFFYQRASEELVARAQRMRAVAARHGLPLTAVAMAYALRQPAVECVVIGARSVEEVRDNAEAFGLRVPDGIWGELVDEGLLPGAAAPA